MRIVSEEEFSKAIRAKLAEDSWYPNFCVTGPGRSGAIAAGYASHILNVPFVPFKSSGVVPFNRILLIDTACKSGETMRKAVVWYQNKKSPMWLHSLIVFQEPPRVMFWYEAPKPQRYRHEQKDWHPLAAPPAKEGET